MMFKYVGDSRSVESGKIYDCRIMTYGALIMVETDLPDSDYGVGIYYKSIREMLEDWQEV